MSSKRIRPRYHDGQEVRLGDVALVMGERSRVVAVTEMDDYSEYFTRDDLEKLEQLSGREMPGVALCRDGHASSAPIRVDDRKDIKLVERASLEECPIRRPTYEDRHRYLDGPEVRVGDVVTWHEHRGRVVFDIEADAYSPAYPREDWAYLGKGIGILLEGVEEGRTALFCYDDVFEEEDIVLVERGFFGFSEPGRTLNRGEL